MDFVAGVLSYQHHNLLIMFQINGYSLIKELYCGAKIIAANLLKLPLCICFQQLDL